MKHTPGPWNIDWYVCTEKGEELWRTPRAIGPIAPDHNHWAGWNLGVEEPDARLIAAAPEMYEALEECALSLRDSGKGALAGEIESLLKRIEGA